MSQLPQRDVVAMARELDQTFLSFIERYSLRFLRYSLVVVFIWFGGLTAMGISETAGLVAAAFGFIPSDLFLLMLGSCEIAVGLALLHRRTIRLGVVLLAVHALVTMIPLVVSPSETFTYFPYGPSFEGVFIIKNWVLLGAVMTVGGLVDVDE